MLRRLESIVSLFTRITTGVLFVTAVYIHVFWSQEPMFGVELLWEILIVSGVCALGAVILPFEEEKEVSKCSMLVRMILYYIFINAVVLSCAFYFGWCAISDWKQILGMAVAIAFVFVVVGLISYWVDYQAAEKMNRRLKERR